MRPIENRITTARRSLGARLLDADSTEGCSGCGQTSAWVQVNIDGIYSYLCRECWTRLGEFVTDPLR